jgi:hypothetical protein
MTKLDELKRLMAKHEAAKTEWQKWQGRESMPFNVGQNFLKTKAVLNVTIGLALPSLIAAAEAAQDYLDMQMDFRGLKVVVDYTEREERLRLALAPLTKEVT